jgi:hypothetical protein
MARYEEPFDDTKEIFENVISNADLSRFINFKLLINNKQKEIYKPIKANDLVKHMTNNDVVIIINERIFEQLNPEQKVMVAEESIAGVHFDAEKDKINFTKGDIQTYSGILRKYGYDKYEVLHESIKTLYNVEREEEAEA